MLPRPAYGRFLHLLLAGALLLCHGFFGALHLAPDTPTHSLPAGSHGAGHTAEGHGGTGHGEHPEHHNPDAGYFAVLIGILLGVLVLPILGFGRQSAASLCAPRRSAKDPSARVPNFARGPTLPTLQVFRL